MKQLELIELVQAGSYPAGLLYDTCNNVIDRLKIDAENKNLALYFLALCSPPNNVHIFA